MITSVWLNLGLMTSSYIVQSTIIADNSPYIEAFPCRSTVGAAHSSIRRSGWLIISVWRRLWIIVEARGACWRHQMVIFSAFLVLCAGNFPVTGEFSSQRPATWSSMFSFICAWINGWVNNRDTGDLRRHRAHYDVTVMGHVNVYHIYALILVKKAILKWTF